MDFYDYAQDSKIQRINETAHELEAQTLGIEQRLEATEKRLKQLVLVSEAMFSLLGEQLNLGEAELLARIQVVVEARKNRTETKLTCSSCQRELVSTRKKCMYCGGELAGATVTSPFVF